MSTFLERLQEEQKELDTKLSKLTEFLETPAFKNLSPQNRELLFNQEVVMSEYSDILANRIELNSK